MDILISRDLFSASNIMCFTRHHRDRIIPYFVYSDIACTGNVLRTLKSQVVDRKNSRSASGGNIP